MTDNNNSAPAESVDTQEDIALTETEEQLAEGVTFAVTALGFWLPCGRANFFHSRDKQERLMLANESHNYQLAEMDILDRSKRQSLQASVYRRLAFVLREKHFSHAFPLYPPYAQKEKERLREIDPDRIFLTCHARDISKIWRPGPKPKGLLVSVTASGYYLLTAVHTIDDRSSIRNALKEFIVAHIFGGDYFSHYSGREDDPSGADAEEWEKEQTLIHYRDEALGALNLFQINLILEGLHNATFDDQAFFHQSNLEQFGERPEMAQPSLEDIKKQYTLGNFGDLIVTDVPLPTDAEEEIAKTILTLIYYPDINNKQLEDLLFTIDTYLLHNTTFAYLMRQFLRGTNSELLKLKWRIERCRRSLLKEMISIMHLKQPLLQLETPDYQYTDDGKPIFDYMLGANDSQLRGYAMLIAAKMPLIKNIRRYLESNFTEIDDPTSLSALPIDNGSPKTEQVENPNENQQEVNIKHIVKSWHALVDAIDESIDELEQAINQARADKRLYLDERIRAEQETIAEIERMRQQRETELSATGEATIGVIANLLAFTALFVSMVTFGFDAITRVANPSQTSSSITTLDAFVQQTQAVWQRSPWLILSSLAVLLVLFILLSYLFHGITKVVLNFFNHVRFLVFDTGKNFYYEFDMRLDIPLRGSKVHKLFDGETEYLNLRKSWWSRVRNPFLERHQPVSERTVPLPYYTNFERNAYRVERDNEDEGLHKVHFSISLKWPRYWKSIPLWKIPLPIYFIRTNNMNCHVTYEILYHRPSASRSFILRECRMVATYNRFLDRHQIRDLKEVAVKHFVHPFIEESEWRSIPIQPLEPLFAMSIYDEQSLMSRQAELERLREPATMVAPAS